MSGDYKSALEAAGATVHEFKEFGSYQGAWFALVTVDGEKGWIQGSYGSCSGCDAFEGEFGWDEREECEEHRWHAEHALTCAACIAAKAAYNTKLAAFGKTYFPVVTPGSILAELDKNGEWSYEDKEAAAWLRSLV